MPQIKVLKPFKFAHRGVEVQEFEPSEEPVEATQEMLDHEGLVEEGFFEVVGEAGEKTTGKAKAKPKA